MLNADQYTSYLRTRVAALADENQRLTKLVGDLKAQLSQARDQAALFWEILKRGGTVDDVYPSK